MAAGLANPSKQIGEGVVASSVVTPKLFIYTDGGFADVEGFSLGNLEPEVVVIGPPRRRLLRRRPTRSRDGQGPGQDPVATTWRSSPSRPGANDEKPDVYQVFGRVHNYRAEAVDDRGPALPPRRPTSPATPGTLIDAIALKIPAQSDQSFKFDLPDTGPDRAGGPPRRSRTPSTLDNRAFTVVGNPRKAQVLVVTPGNRYLVDTLKTPIGRRARRRHDRHARGGQERRRRRATSRAGRYDLVIYDRVRPESPPEANALYFGVLPPGPAYEKSKDVEQPVILDWDVAHPLMQYIRDLSTGRHRQGQRRRAARRGDEPDREQPGPARLRRPPRRATPTPSSPSR